MSITKKFLSIILAILMIVSTMPMAFAADEDANATCVHDYDEIKSEDNLTRPTKNEDGSWSQGYYTYSCLNGCGEVKTEYVNRADYTDIYEAFATIKEYYCNAQILITEKENLVDELDEFAIENSIFMFNPFNLIESEQSILDTAHEDLQAIINAVDARIASGEALKADYTEIGAKIAEFQKTHSSEEYNGLFAGIIADYNAMTAENHETAADAAADISAIEAKMNKAENCEHACHKDGIMGFIWKIINFISQFFGSNPVCECGVTHYAHVSASAEFVPAESEDEDIDIVFEDVEDNDVMIYLIMSSLISSTLENPEFVAADNEATNVLDNGD